MSRNVRSLGIALLIGLTVALYREWVVRNQPPLFLPLGFFESAEPVVTPENMARQVGRWKDPVKPVVMNDSDFDEVVRFSRAERKTVDILVIGGTLGGTAAMLSAAEEGARTLLVTDGDWNEDILTYAGFFLEETPPPVFTSGIESEIRNHISRTRGIMRTERGLPSDVAEYLRKKIDALQLGAVLSGYSLTALVRDESGQLHRALVRSTDGTHSFEIGFKTIIDGTKEGTLLALAGVESRSGWDAGTGESSSLPQEAINALLQGYTMSGRTVEGIGRRLDGVRAQMGIIDRGYHGTYIPPERTDACWEKADVTSIFARQTILRTQKTGCSARFSFRSSFEDTVEVFFVNHGNERVSATIRVGSGTSLEVETVGNPSESFIRIGAFPVNNSTPLNIDIHSSLPTDKLEGLIVRKLNTGMTPPLLTVGGGRESSYSGGPWTYTNNDIYVHATGLETPPTIAIDSEFFATKKVGTNTYVANDIALTSQEHSIRIAENTVDEARLAIIPLSPAERQIKTEPRKDGASWEVTPVRDGQVVITMPRKACRKGCSFIMKDERANVMLSGVIAPLAGQPATKALLGLANVRGGSSYVISIESPEKSGTTPIISYVEETAGIHKKGITTAVLSTPSNGRMYDVWVHTPRSEMSTVSIRGTTTKIHARNGWAYAGSSISSLDDISVKAGGFVEMYAIPNTSLDVYNITLSPEESLSIHKKDLPSGTYDISAYSETNPWTMSVTNGRTNTVQQVAFVEAMGYFVSQQPLIWHHDDSILISSSEWPLNITIHQSVAETSVIAPSEASTPPLFTVLATPLSVTNDEILLKASGSMLFTPAPGGIAPVTIGLLEHPQTDTYVRSILDAAFARLRYAEIPDTCIGKNDPTCDARRYVRDPTIFDTNDSQSVRAVTVDGRRLIGLETLSESGAFAVRTPCGSRCNSLCIDGTIADSTCLEAGKNPPYDQRSILAVRGTNSAPSIMSSNEDVVRTLPSLLHALRRDGLLAQKKTYLERMQDARDFSLTLGMFVPRTEENLLVANTTLSATHIASRALRSGSTELAIGDAIGHVAAFAALQERSSPGFLARSSEATLRLQQHLINSGIMVFPMFDIENDSLLLKSIQSRLLQQRARTAVMWEDGRLTGTTDPQTGESLDALRSSVFKGNPAFTVEEILTRLSGIPRGNFSDLLNYGLDQGFITEKMLLFNPRELMGQQLDFSLLLKSEYLLQIESKER